MRVDIDDFVNFISAYLQALQACGAYVSRCHRCAKRIANAYGYEITINFFFNNTALMLKDMKNPCIKETIVLRNPLVNVNLAVLRELSALSWDIHDKMPSLQICYENLQEVVERNSTKRPLLLSFLISSVAFGALCRLFGGDFIAMILVFFCVFVSTIFRHFLTKINIDIRLQYLFLSFFSSSFVAFFAMFLPEFSLHIALATSTLYLIPGVFFINSVIDILDNHILVGFSRIVNIGILILCMALGVYLTLVIFKIGTLS